MMGDMGHMDGLINPRPGRGQYRAGFSNTGGSPKPRKRAPCLKKDQLRAPLQGSVGRPFPWAIQERQPQYIYTLYIIALHHLSDVQEHCLASVIILELALFKVDL